MKIALCHLNLSYGPQKLNLQLLQQAMLMAAKQGAQWVLTPEMAVQGYYFYNLDKTVKVKPQPAPELQPLADLCREYKLTLFLGCGEYDTASDKSFKGNGADSSVV